MANALAVLLVLAILLLAAGTALCIRRRHIPFVTKRRTWSIGILTGRHPLDLASQRGVHNPVLTSRQVTDVDAEFVADPFLVRDGGGWLMFFEVLNRSSGRGEIGLARSADGFRWMYDAIVLREPFHLSFPYVFEWEGKRYMVPECCTAGAIRLYEARDFPTTWVHRADIIEGEYVDPTPFVWNDHWYLMAKDRRSHILRLFEADRLDGPWSEHPRSPVRVDDLNFSRPGGNVTVLDGRLYRFAQDYEPHYGSQVWAMEITTLAPECYGETLARPRPIITRGMGGRSWNSQGMHQVSPLEDGSGRWIAAVDGYGDLYSLRLRP